MFLQFEFVIWEFWYMNIYVQNLQRIPEHAIGLIKSALVDDLSLPDIYDKIGVYDYRANSFWALNYMSWGPTV